MHKLAACLTVAVDCHSTPGRRTRHHQHHARPAFPGLQRGRRTHFAMGEKLADDWEGLRQRARQCRTRYDTSELCCDSIAANHHVFKEALQALAELPGLKIRIAHYQPYCSKHKHRTLLVSTHHPCLLGSGLTYRRHCRTINGTGQDGDRTESYRRCFGQCVQNGEKVYRGFYQCESCSVNIFHAGATELSRPVISLSYFCDILNLYRDHDR